MTPLYRQWRYFPALLMLPILFFYWPGDWRPLSKQEYDEFDDVTSTASFLPSTTFALLSSPTTPSPESSPTPQTLTLVVARLQKEDVSWIKDELPDIQTAVYVVDDPTAELHVPQNKGHEAMVYLSYIIDHYDSLSDTTIFIHSDRITWHNNDFLDSDLVKMIQRLNPERVQREKYFNLRCHAQPGCSDNLHLNRVEPNGDKPEETVIKTVWSELHPTKPMPDTLSSPCCGQFAASKTAILSHPLSQYIKWREWLLHTELEDSVSGRIWEYTWHYILGGKADMCADTHICYCDGYGVCFESSASMQAWFDLDTVRKKAEEDYNKWDKLHKDASSNDERELLGTEIEQIRVTLDQQKQQALQRGLDPIARKNALES